MDIYDIKQYITHINGGLALTHPAMDTTCCKTLLVVVGFDFSFCSYVVFIVHPLVTVYLISSQDFVFEYKFSSETWSSLSHFDMQVALYR